MSISATDNLIRLILAILSTYRLARMIALDDGPLFIFKRLRYWAKDRSWWEADAANAVHGAEISDRWFGKWHNLAEGLGCPFCAGVWVSLPLFALLLWPTVYGDAVLLLMSISGAQAFLQSLDAKR